MKTTILDITGVTCLALFAYSLWAPACLLVVGISALLVSWRSVESKPAPRPTSGGDL